MITVASWTRAATLGAAVLVAMEIVSARPLATVTVDLLGDGLPGVSVVSPSEGFGGVGILARRLGTFRLQVDAVDVAGCVGRTGAVRDVQVTR